MNPTHNPRSKISTKDKIISAALKSFAKNGIEQTKLIDIAEAAKIKHNLILYHFQDFEELCKACIEQVVHNFFKETQKISLEKQKNASKHLEEFILGHFQLAKLHPAAFSLWLHFYYKASIDPHYKQLLKTISTSSMEKLKSIFMQYSIEKNLTHTETQIEYYSQIVIGQIIGQLMLSLSEEKPNFANEAKICFELSLDLLDNSKHS